MATWQPHRLEERGCQLPPLIKPEGPGYMPLYCAAQWIATEGGSIEIEPRDVAVWKDAFSALLARMASEEATVTGMRDGVREKIAGHLFASIQIDYPFSDTPFDLLVSEELFLSSCVYLDEANWRKGFDDRLESRWGVKWSKLMVLKSEVARWWPFESATPKKPDAAIPVRTGAPGRPSYMHLVLIEHSARWDRGETEGGIGAEARALRAWFDKAHPSLPPPSTVTIETRIRDDYWKRKGIPRK